jgi:hypothetical protein
MTREDHVRQAFRDQVQAGRSLGSPFTARFCELVAERLDRSTTVGEAVLDWPGDAGVKGDLLPARLAGALHALVIDAREPGLTAVYPPQDATDDTLWSGIVAAMKNHGDFILDRLKSAPQTNEVRRSAALLPSFLTVAELTGKPLRLLEVGASMGLNLNCDRFHYDLGGFKWGDPAAAVRLAPTWEGGTPPAAKLEIAERAGCDLNPLDPHSDDDTLRLLSYLWADQADRVTRTRAAIDIARMSPARIDRADALVWLQEQLAEPRNGVATIVYHSIAWQYLPPEARAKGDAIIAEAGDRATEDAPLCRLQMEADANPHGATLSLQIWPTGETRQLGRADFHGRWVQWQGW